jgi:hypothetical protein
MMGAENLDIMVPETCQAFDRNGGLSPSRQSVPASKLKQEATTESNGAEHGDSSTFTPEHNEAAEHGEDGKEEAVHDLDDDPPRTFPQKVRVTCSEVLAKDE